jgi:hypothetical protein
MLPRWQSATISLETKSMTIINGHSLSIFGLSFLVLVVPARSKQEKKFSLFSLARFVELSVDSHVSHMAKPSNDRCHAKPEAAIVGTKIDLFNSIHFRRKTVIKALSWATCRALWELHMQANWAWQLDVQACTANQNSSTTPMNNRHLAQRFVLCT